MDFKAVNKSKSSNSAIASKPEKRKNKKSRSSAEFQPFIIKKRGVYVEKKSQPAIGVAEAKDEQMKIKPPPRPRPGQKKFLASVLTILAKATTGTQYPDTDEPKEKAKTKRWKIEKSPDSVCADKTKIKKTKFKSRILKNEQHRSEKDQFIVLQSKKDIVKTPSNYSERSKSASDTKKLSEILNDRDIPKRSAIRDVLENNIYSGVAEGLSKQILEDKTKRKKLRINDDPKTFEESQIAAKDDKKLYNFFVDLLETTMSVYNVKAEYENKDVSKTILEINESVAKKLEINNENPTSDSVCKLGMQPERRAPIDVKSHEHIPLHVKLSDFRPLAPVEPKIKAKSFIHPRYSRKTKTPSKSDSFNNKKKFARKKDKKTLLNILKEELKFDTHTFEEPESLYDALKVLAKNKKRYEKSIRFHTKVDRTNDDYFEPECRLKRRKILSLRSKKRNKTLNTKIETPTQSIYRSQGYFKEINQRRSEPSNHSLEVYGYDYEEPYKRPEVKNKKQIILTYHSTPSQSELMVDDCNALLDYPPDSVSGSEYSYKR